MLLGDNKKGNNKSALNWLNPQVKLDKTKPTASTQWLDDFLIREGVAREPVAGARSSERGSTELQRQGLRAKLRGPDHGKWIVIGIGGILSLLGLALFADLRLVTAPIWRSKMAPRLSEALPGRATVANLSVPVSELLPNGQLMLLAPLQVIRSHKMLADAHGASLPLNQWDDAAQPSVAKSSAGPTSSSYHGRSLVDANLPAISVETAGMPTPTITAPPPAWPMPLDSVSSITAASLEHPIIIDSAKLSPKRPPASQKGTAMNVVGPASSARPEPSTTKAAMALAQSGSSGTTAYAAPNVHVGQAPPISPLEAAMKVLPLNAPLKLRISYEPAGTGEAFAAGELDKMLQQDLGNVAETDLVPLRVLKEQILYFFASDRDAATRVAESLARITNHHSNVEFVHPKQLQPPGTVEIRLPSNI